MTSLFFALLLIFSNIVLCTVFASERESEFKYNCVIVSLKSEITQYDENMFPEVEITSIKELANLKTGFILLLNINANSEDAVKSAVNSLNQNQYIRYAEPNYIGGGYLF